MDLIDRQAVRLVEMDEKQEHPTFNLDDAYEQGFEDCLTKVLVLPSVQPERKKGKWIVTDDGWDGEYFVCSVCGCPWKIIEGTPKMNYCPNCGAKMEGEQE